MKPIFLPQRWSLTLREEHRLRVLRRVFGPKRDEVTGEWRKLHNEELKDLYSSPSIVRVVKSRRGHWGDPDVSGRIILRWIFRKLEGDVGTGWSWLGIGTGGRHL